jgi:hypothetical protein
VGKLSWFAQISCQNPLTKLHNATVVLVANVPQLRHDWGIDERHQTMTFEEIQQAIEGLLSVQRNLQEGQLGMQGRQQATDERLDRLTGITERYINASTGVIERLDRNVEQMIQAQSETFNIVREMQAEVRTIAADVKGLQTENRRILDRVFGQGEGN